MEYKELIFNKENVEDILKYFIGLGITDVKSILLYKTYLIYDDINNIKNAFENVDKNTIKIINEDIMNLDMIGL